MVPSDTSGRTGVVCAERGRLDVVVDARPPTRRSLDAAGEVEGVHVEVDRVPGPAGLPVDEPGHAGPEVLDAAPSRRPRTRRGRRRRPRSRAPGCCPARTEPRPAATTPPESSSTSAAVLVPPMSMPSLTGPPHHGAGPAGRAPRRASRRRSRCRHRRAASRTRRARRRGPRRAAARRRPSAGWSAPTARPTTATLAPGRHGALGDRRAEGGRAPRDAADGEVGGAADLHDRERAGRGEPGPRPAPLTRKACCDGLVGQRRGPTSPRMPAAPSAGRRRRQGAHPLRRLGHPVLGQPTRVHGRHDGRVHGVVGLLGRARAEAEQVDAGDEGAHRGLGDAGLGARAGHVECVAHDDAVEAELVAQQRRSRSRENVAGRSGSIAGTMMCEVMTAATPGVDGRPEGRELALARAPRAVDVDARQAEVRVDHGVAVAREVLRAGGDPGGLQALDPRGRVARDEGGVVAEAAHADDRVVGGGVDVDDRARGRG